MKANRSRYGYISKLLVGVCPCCLNPYDMVYWLYWMNPWWRCGVCFKAVGKVEKQK